MKILYVWKNRVQKFIDNPRAIVPFLWKRIYYNHVADKQLKYYRDFHYLDYKQTIDDIIDNNKSIIRFGDELFDMLQGIGLYYGNWHQKYDKRLADRLKEIISSKNERILLCFNPELILKTKKEFQKEGIGWQYHFWTNSKMFLKDYYHKDVVYGSALCFNPRYNQNINYNKLKNFFLQKNIIVVASNIQRFKDIKLGKTTDFVESPKSDAWRKYEEIKKDIIDLIKNKGLAKPDVLVLASIGSASKVLVYELTKQGFVSWDTGQFFDLAWSEIKKNLDK